METKKTKISRKDLKQPDRVEESLYKFVDYAYRKRQQFIIGGFVLILFILGGWGYQQYDQSEQIKQNELFNQAQKIFRNEHLSEVEKQTQGIASLQTFLQQSSQHFLSVIALMQLGDLLIQQKKWNEAEKAFNQVLDHRQASSYMKNLARVSVSAIYENQKQWDNALKMIETLEEPLWNALRWKSLARIALAKGDVESAKLNLQQLIESSEPEVLKQNASLLLMQLK